MDRYSPHLFFLLLLILAFNILDALFTMVILEYGGWEINPVVRSAIHLYGDGFWVWKFIVVAICLILLCVHSHFRAIKAIILATASAYVGIVLYEIFLIYFKINPHR